MRERLRAGRIGQAMAIRSTCVIENSFVQVLRIRTRDSCEPRRAKKVSVRLKFPDRTHG